MTPSPPPPRVPALAGLVSLVLLVTGAVVPSSAGADVTATATMPATVSFPAARSLEYRLHLQAGAEPERFTVRVTPSTFATDGTVEGGLVAPTDHFTLEGAGRLGQAAVIRGTGACSPLRNRPHGHGYVRIEADVDLPARGAAVFVIRADADPDSAPWPGMDHRVTFRLHNRRVDGRPGTLAAPTTVRPARPTLIGNRGVRVSLAARPRLGRPAVGRPTALRRGRVVVVRGRLNPPLARHPVRLRLLRRGAPFRTVAAGRTDRRGRFAYRFRAPRRAGAYELWAFVAPSRSTVADYACPRAFTVLR